MLVVRESLLNTLMWPYPIEVRHTLIEPALELLLLENQEGIETFATNAVQKPFTLHSLVGLDKAF